MKVGFCCGDNIQMMKVIKQRWIAYLLLGLFLFVAAYRYARPVNKVLDIGFNDETRYLNEGVYLREENLHTLRAPLYAVWYAGLARVERDPLALYDLNLRLQIILLPMVLFAALLLSRVPPFWAFLIGWGWLLTDANLEPWPRVSAFAWIMLMLGIGLYQRFRASFKGWGFLLTAVGLSMYARPEMMLPFALLAVTAIWAVEKRQRKALLIWLGALILLLVALFGSPNEPGRLFEAFGQHFAFRWHKQYVTEGLLWNHWQEALDKAFGAPVNSFRDVLQANPWLVEKHILANLRDVPKQWGKLLFSHTPYLFKHHSLWEGILWIFIAVLGGGIGLWRRKDDKAFWKSQAFTFWVLGVLALPSLGSVLLIYPREHYLLGPTLLIWYAWALIVFGKTDDKSQGFLLGRIPSRQLYVLGGAVAVLLTATTPLVTEHFGFSPILDVRQTLVTLRVLQKEEGIKFVAVPGDVWGDHNVEVYFPNMNFLLIDPSPSSLLAKGLPNTQVIVLDNGNVWLKVMKDRDLLREFQHEGWFVLCTSRKPYLVLTRVMPTTPIPMKLCNIQ